MNQIDFGERIYDPRIGRFLSVDRNFWNLVDFSPYQYARNNPIMLMDDGGDGIVPKWLWKNFIITPYAAGFIDAIADDVTGLWEAGKIYSAFTPSTFYYWTVSGAKVRRETLQLAKTVITLIKDPRLQVIVATNVAATSISILIKWIAYKQMQFMVPAK